ncbi:GmrSD restriction endonuclease domain-containing protein [Streptomyces sp. KMM 9044]|uniref:DUF262 domain-containing protein n=1 Tax=Streptomyces sp. KMM 9044 TaxID=2744474 RepID=UPI0021706A0F
MRAPEPTIAPITSLASRVLSGDIVLPKFQRAFVWTPQQILYLLDSVRRNYPIGSLLMWRTTAKLASGQRSRAWTPCPSTRAPRCTTSSTGRQQLQAAVADAGKAAARAVDFLSTQIRTPQAEALPCYNQFAVPVELFRQLPKPTAAQYEAVTRWFWLTASSEYFKGWRESQMGPDLSAVTEFAAGRSTEVETAAALPRALLWQRAQFSRQNAPGKLLVLLMSYEKSVDLNTGLVIDVADALSWQNGKQLHHFFPRAYLKKEGVKAGRDNVCGNLIMLSAITNNWISDRRPSAYLRDLAVWHGEDVLRERLRTCLIEEDAYQAALRDDYDAFLRARSKTLHRRLMELIGSAAGSSGDWRSARSAQRARSAPAPCATASRCSHCPGGTRRR